MIETKTIPPIEVLTDIAPVEHNGSLDSPKLHEKVLGYSLFQGEMWGKFLDSPAGSPEEEDAARKLGTYYFLKTADTLQHYTEDKSLWTKRFNTATEELYGLPDRVTALGIIATDNAEFLRSLVPTFATKLYGSIAKDTPKLPDTDKEVIDLHVLREVLLAYIPEISATIEAIDDKEYTPAEVRDVFQAILDKLADTDPGWSDWKITNKPNKTMLSVASASKTIDVPDGRTNVSSKKELLGLAFHEIGVHAVRGNNGSKITELLARGLPGYGDFEEGLGVVFEYIATGEIPQKSKDRYVDIALAAGIIGTQKMSRTELIELGISREHTRANITGAPLRNDAEIVNDITARVNRIFRGGNGLPIYKDGKIIEQAIFPKDIAYYKGFEIASNYITQKLSEGVAPTAIFEFLLKGKFDPTNIKHTAYLKEHGIDSL